MERREQSRRFFSCNPSRMPRPTPNAVAHCRCSSIPGSARRMKQDTVRADFLLGPVRSFLALPASAQQATDALAPVVAVTDGLQPFSLDRIERHIRQEIMANNPAAVPSRGWRQQQSQRPVSWLDLCNGDGYVRERCLSCLGSAPNAFFMSLAIRRLNDWVPEVRRSAREHLLRIAIASDPWHVAKALGRLLATMSSWGRMEADDWRIVGCILSIEEVAARLTQLITQATAGPQAAVLVQAARTPALDHTFLDLATHAMQPAVRATAYRFLLAGHARWINGRTWIWTELKWCKGRFEPVFAQRELETDWSPQAVLTSALEDRSAHVRRIGGEFLARHLDTADARTWATRLAADRSPCVSMWGRHVLTRLAENHLTG